MVHAAGYAALVLIGIGVLVSAYRVARVESRMGELETLVKLRTACLEQRVDELADLAGRSEGLSRYAVTRVITAQRERSTPPPTSATHRVPRGEAREAEGEEAKGRRRGR